MNPYLNADQLHVLANAFSKSGHSSASKLITRKGIPTPVVEQLFVDGYLSKKGRRYFANRRTEVALVEHGFDLDEIEIEEKPSPVKEISKEKKLEKHILSERAENSMRSRAEIQAILLKRAKDKALAGDPWDYVRRQWPELIIRDELDLRYFAKHCNRKHALDLRLDDAQVELIDYAFDPSIREIAIKGSTSPGKGFATALLLNIRYSIYGKDRITLLSQSTKHAKDVMFAEMVTWRKKMRYPDDCEILAAGIKNPEETKHFVAIANPETGEGLSGGHGAHVTFSFDEASCHDDQTEILTESGWKQFSELMPGESVLVMNKETSNSYYEVPEDIICEPYSGDMICSNTRTSNFCVTPNHRMLVHRVKYNKKKQKSEYKPSFFIRADEAKLASRQHLMRKTSNWQASDASTYTIPELKGEKKSWGSQEIDMDDWLMFLGIFSSDGTFSRVKGTAYTVVITQKKDRESKEIQDLLDRLPFPYARDLSHNGSNLWRINSRWLCSHLEEMLGPNKSKRIFPGFIGNLSSRQIRIFVDWYAMGDAAFKKSGAKVIYTQLKSTADYLQVLSLKAGYNATVTKRKLKGQKSTMRDGRVVESKMDGYQTSVLVPRKGYYATDTYRKHYTGNVYCVSMPRTDVVLTRRNGRVLWSGNSVPPELPINARKQANLIIYISNPRVLSGFFYDLYPKVEPDKNQVIVDKGIKRACLTFGGHGALNVRAKRLSIPYGPPGGLEGETIDGEKFFIAEGDKVPDHLIPHTRPLIPGQMDYAKYRTIMLSPNETERAWSGEGKFPPEDADFQIVVPSWLKDPCAMWNLHKDEIEVTGLGLDLAQSLEGDETVLAAGGSLGIKKIFRTKKANSLETLSWVVKCCEGMGFDLYSGEVPIAIDAIGAGGHVIAELMEKNGAIVYPMKGNKKAENTSLYVNTRAELYGELGVRLDPNSAYVDLFMIPDDDKLKEELTAHEKHYTSDMTRFQATAKIKSRGALANIQPIKEKIGRSPDTADAVVLCHWVIRDTEGDAGVVQQFNPAEALEAYRKTEQGSVLEGRGDGNVHEVSQEEFDSEWGTEPTTIEDEMASLRAAWANTRNGGTS